MSVRLFRQAVSLACAYLTWSPPGHSQIPVAWQGAPTAEPREAATPDDTSEKRAEERRKSWMLSVEGVTHAPIDAGLQLGLQTPQGIRFSGGVGWVPGSYMSLLTGIAANASGDAYARALLDHAEYEGRTWRLQLGIQPFRAIGLYADVGYARLSANGSLAMADSGISALERLGGAYVAHTQLDMWLLELGYQGQVADRLVLGLALGVMGTWSSTTTLSAIDGARSSPLLSTIAADTDSALEKYGVVPTLTLRIGFDLI